MKKRLILLLILSAGFVLGYFTGNLNFKNEYANAEEKLSQNDSVSMQLGAFSLSLNVENLERSKAFYEQLGFSVFVGSLEENYLIMKSNQIVIGLFYGMFEPNIMTFNPGWDQNANPLEHYTDIREIYQHLKSLDVEFLTDTVLPEKGPASFMISDPDGNILLFDQHMD